MSLVGVHPARAEEGAKAIPWLENLPAVLKEARATNKPVLVLYGERVDPDAEQKSRTQILRESLYKKALVVERAADFLCVYMPFDPKGKEAMEALFGEHDAGVVPQHVFVHPRHVPGEKPMLRETGWPHAGGEKGLQELVRLLKRAKEAFKVRETVPWPDDDTPKGRAAWIKRAIRLVRDGGEAYRLTALERLYDQDKDGDCLRALVPVVASFIEKKEHGRLLDAMRYALVPEAAPHLHELLSHDDDNLRANAAVTLEYIGAPESVEPLLARLKREKNDAVANHMYRALGRCGRGQDDIRKRLLRKCAPAKGHDFARFGAVIGLAYFEADAKAARGLERHLNKLGMPHQTGSKARVFLRAVMFWALSEIRDPKSGAFIQKRYLDKLVKEDARRVEAVMRFYGAVARTCEGSDELREQVEEGIKMYLWRDRANELADVARQNRNMRKFRPKGEWRTKSTHEE